MTSSETAFWSIQTESCYAYDSRAPQYETSDESVDGQEERASTMSEATGDSFHQVSELSHLREYVTAAIGHLGEKSQSKCSRASTYQFLQAGIPTFSNGLTTFSYQQALRNRISESKLQQGADYDIESYTPTFIHDCLMLPGSLANMLHKVRLPRAIRRYQDLLTRL